MIDAGIAGGQEHVQRSPSVDLETEFRILDRLHDARLARKMNDRGAAAGRAPYGRQIADIAMLIDDGPSSTSPGTVIDPLSSTTICAPGFLA